MTHQPDVYIRGCKKCHGVTVIVYAEKTTATCGKCGEIHDVTWSPKVHTRETDLL